MVAQPHLPRVRALQGWVVIDVERLEGEVISLCGAGGVCEAINEIWLAACRIKDQLKTKKSPPRRIYNPLCCGLGSFGFNLHQRFRACSACANFRIFRIRFVFVEKVQNVE